jgi:hypothetical protein
MPKPSNGMPPMPAIWANQFQFQVSDGVTVITYGVNGMSHGAVAMPIALVREMVRQLNGVIGDAPVKLEPPAAS